MFVTEVTTSPADRSRMPDQTEEAGERYFELDASGRCLCNPAIWGRRCKAHKRGKECPYSHDVPEEVRARALQTRQELIAEKRVANAARQAALKQFPPPPLLVSPRIEALRAEAVLDYDRRRHRLGELAAALLECAPGEELSALHLRPDPLPAVPPLCPTLQHAFRAAGRKIPPRWARVMGAGRNKKVILQMHASSAYTAWLEAYDGWVREVVLPAVGEDLYYQRPPTLRVAMPSQHVATIGVHRDADYHGHHAAEINFWCARSEGSKQRTAGHEPLPAG